jgi:hypothetical protein
MEGEVHEDGAETGNQEDACDPDGFLHRATRQTGINTG